MPLAAQTWMKGHSGLKA